MSQTYRPAPESFQVNHHIHPHVPVTAAVVRKVLQTVMFQILCTLQF